MNAGTQIPMPPRRWIVRIGVPLLVLLAAAALLLGTMWSSIMPARAVRTVPALVRNVDAPINEPAAAATSDAIVQAPGWVEPDPFGVYAGALAEGVIKDVLVLEGDSVAADQPVAMLVDDDARIALQHAQATLVHLKADTATAQNKPRSVPARIRAAKANRDALADEVRRKNHLGRKWEPSPPDRWNAFA